MRSIAQKRLTAVGRVDASSAQIVSNSASSVRRIGLRNADGNAHRGRDADGGSAANHHGADGIGDLQIIRGR